MRNITKICVSLVLLVIVGCRTAYNECGTTVLSRNNYLERIVVDSVVVRDSVFVKEKADTVFYTKFRTLYKERLRVDTIVCCDTVFCDREVVVEREKPIAASLRPLTVVLLCCVILFFLWRAGVLGIVWGFILKCSKLCIKVFRLKE